MDEVFIGLAVVLRDYHLYRVGADCVSYDWVRARGQGLVDECDT